MTPREREVFVAGMLFGALLTGVSLLLAFVINAG